jgi:CRISPR/Cas system endoribonuclease Cas6 (RAMP superfamily)
MGDKGEKDKGKREQQKKTQLNPKEKRKSKRRNKKRDAKTCANRMLLDFAFYSGIGVKNTHGMGMCR